MTLLTQPPAVLAVLFATALTASQVDAKQCDPAGSWLAYAVARGGGAPVTRISTTAIVPPLPTAPGAEPAIWYGLEPVPACDLIQPIWKVLGDSWYIFNEEFNWYTGSDFQSRRIQVQPGDVIDSSMVLGTSVLGAPELTMTIGKRGGDSVVSKRNLMRDKGAYTDAWFVVEHQPENCRQFPAGGKFTFTNITIELNGTVVEPKWELVKTPSDQCNCTAHSTVPSTVGFTWNV